MGFDRQLFPKVTHTPIHNHTEYSNVCLWWATLFSTGLCSTGSWEEFWAFIEGLEQIHPSRQDWEATPWRDGPFSSHHHWQLLKCGVEITDTYPPPWSPFIWIYHPSDVCWCMLNRSGVSELALTLSPLLFSRCSYSRGYWCWRIRISECSLAHFPPFLSHLAFTEDNRAYSQSPPSFFLSVLCFSSPSPPHGDSAHVCVCLFW